MKRILVLDFEATGRDVKTDRITEVAAVLINPEAWEEMYVFESFLYGPTYPPLPQEVADLTKLTDEFLQQNGKDPEEVLIKLQKQIQDVDYVLCFNKSYDQNLFINEMNRHSLVIPKTKWVCCLEEMPYPERIRGKMLKLMYLALEHGLTVDPTKLHRAINDVRLLLQILQKYNWHTIEEYFNTPTVKLKAETTYDQRELARVAGFRWDPAIKAWWKQVKVNEVPGLRKNLPFAVTEIHDSCDVP